ERDVDAAQAGQPALADEAVVAREERHHSVLDEEEEADGGEDLGGELRAPPAHVRGGERTTPPPYMSTAIGTMEMSGSHPSATLSPHAPNMPSIMNSPWAKLIISIRPQMMASPTATSA